MIPKPPNSNELEEEYNLEKCIMRRGYRRLHIVFFRGRLAHGLLSFVRGSDHRRSYWWLRWANRQVSDEVSSSIGLSQLD